MNKVPCWFSFSRVFRCLWKKYLWYELNDKDLFNNLQTITFCTLTIVENAKFSNYNSLPSSYLEFSENVLISICVPSHNKYAILKKLLKWKRKKIFRFHLLRNGGVAGIAGGGGMMILLYYNPSLFTKYIVTVIFIVADCTNRDMAERFYAVLNINNMAFIDHFLK